MSTGSSIEEPLVPNHSYYPGNLDRVAVWGYDVPSANPLVPAIPTNQTRPLVAHLNSTGKLTLVEFFKHAIVRDINVRYRDAFMLDPMIPIPFPASLLIREKALIVNFEAVRIIICPNQCYVISVPKEGNPSQGVPPTLDHPFILLLSESLAHMNDPVFHLSASQSSVESLQPVESTNSNAAAASTRYPAKATAVHSMNSCGPGHLVGKEFDSDTPYELRALEVAFRVVLHALRHETHLLETTGYPALDRMVHSVTALSLRQVRDLKKDLAELTKRVETLRNEVDKILRSDHDMADMYLGRRAVEQGLTLPPQPKEEIERAAKERREWVAEKRYSSRGDVSFDGRMGGNSSRQEEGSSNGGGIGGGGGGGEESFSFSEGKQEGVAENDDNDGKEEEEKEVSLLSASVTYDGLPAASKRALLRSATGTRSARAAAHVWKMQAASFGNTFEHSAQNSFAALVSAAAALAAETHGAASSAEKEKEKAPTTATTTFSQEESNNQKSKTKTSLPPLSQQQQPPPHEGKSSLDPSRLLLPYAIIDPHDIEAAEDLMESAFINLDQILRSLTLLAERIAGDELLVRIAMDSRRNELVQLELMVSNVSMAFGYVAMIGGIFGMNLVQTLWIGKSPRAFWSVIIVSAVGMVVLPLLVIWYMRRRRLNMMFEAAL